MFFPEDFLHYVWKFRLFDRVNLQTNDGEELEILSAGLHNSNSGPDFHNARIRIGDTVWQAMWKYTYHHQTGKNMAILLIMPMTM